MAMLKSSTMGVGTGLAGCVQQTEWVFRGFYSFGVVASFPRCEIERACLRPAKPPRLLMRRGFFFAACKQMRVRVAEA